MRPTIRNIIDLHCDTLSECAKRRLMLKNKQLAFSLDKLPQNFRLCQAMAVFMPDDLRGEDAELYFEHVYENFLLQMRQFDEDIQQVTNTAEIEQVLSEKDFAAILTVEGGSVLCGKIENVSRLCDLGVRMITLTWNAENEICGGAATNVGFTDFGRAVVSEMEQLRMAVDVSHLSDAGFWQLCEFAKKPFVASHSNSRAICNHRRNLTDEMFTEIAKRGGVVGINYYKNFIRDDAEDGTMVDLLRHVHHFLGLGGENAIALGSDFDGASVPSYISGIDKIEQLALCLEKSGIDAKTVDKILFENANRFFVNLAGGNNA